MSNENPKVQAHQDARTTERERQQLRLGDKAERSKLAIEDDAATLPRNLEG
jgi:hypothetical protein